MISIYSVKTVGNKAIQNVTMESMVTLCPTARTLRRKIADPFDPDIEELKLRLMLTVPTLQYACSRVIRRRVGLYNFWQMHKLPLPKSICDSLQKLSLTDFFINPAHVRATHHRENMFPATCVIDGCSVLLSLHEKEESIQFEPTLITTFSCSEIIFAVYEINLSLERLLRYYEQRGLCLEERDIWETFRKLAQLTRYMPPYCVLYPQRIHFKQDAIEYKTSSFDDARFMPEEERNLYVSDDDEDVAGLGSGKGTMMLVRDFDPHTESCYEAPELHRKSTPTDGKCHIWTIGCIIQKIISLRGNQETPMRLIDQFNRLATDPQQSFTSYLHQMLPNRGQLSFAPVKPSEQNAPTWMTGCLKYGIGKYSQELCQLVKRCIQADPKVRPTLEQILERCHEKINASESSSKEMS